MGKTRQRDRTAIGITAKKVIAKVKAKLKGQGINVTQIILFGSHAKGIADKHSDYDFCFIYDPKVYNENDLLLKLTRAIIFELRIIADILVMTEAKFKTNKTSPLVHEIKSYGIVV